MSDNSTVVLGDNDLEGEFGMNLEFRAPSESLLGDGFNKFGVRENDDGSLDVRFNAMEPGERKGVEITPEFLENVVSHDYNRIPLQLDHSDSQRANAGFVDPGSLQYDDILQMQTHIPNTGSSIRDDIIADFTHEPPQITDISVAYDPRTVEIEIPENRGDAPRFVDGRIREFSLTPFPGGYDNGGLTPEFSSAVEKAAISPTKFDEPKSQLIRRPHILITN